MRQLFPIRVLRRTCVAIGLIAAVLAAVATHVPRAHASDAAEFGANFHAWLGLCIVATVAFAIAMFLSRGLIRWAICLLLLLTWWSGIEPARQYYDYVHQDRVR